MGSETTVVGYQKDLVSLPSGVTSPVPLSDVLPESITSPLTPQTLLADEDVVRHRRSTEAVKLYTDAVLKNSKNAMKGFVVQLLKCGLIGACSDNLGTVTPFFVKKKDGRQRLVWDCREVNRQFKRPTRLELFRIEVSPSET